MIFLFRFMEPLQMKHWEGVEVEQYWESIQKLKNGN